MSSAASNSYRHDFDIDGLTTINLKRPAKCSKCVTLHKMVFGTMRGMDDLYSLDGGETWSTEMPVCVIPIAPEKVAPKAKKVSFELTPDEAAIVAGALMMRPETQALGLRLARLYGAAI